MNKIVRDYLVFKAEKRYQIRPPPPTEVRILVKSARYLRLDADSGEKASEQPENEGNSARNDDKVPKTLDDVVSDEEPEKDTQDHPKDDKTDGRDKPEEFYTDKFLSHQVNRSKKQQYAGYG